MLKKFDNFSDIGVFRPNNLVCVYLFLIAVPLAPRSRSFPVHWFGRLVQVELLWVPPILAYAWATFCDELDFWVAHCPAAASMLTSAWCLFSLTKAQVVTVSPIIIALSSPLTFCGTTPQACVFVKSEAWAPSIVFLSVDPPPTFLTFRKSWAVVYPMITYIIAFGADVIGAHLSFGVSNATLKAVSAIFSGLFCYASNGCGLRSASGGGL